MGLQVYEVCSNPHLCILPVWAGAIVCFESAAKGYGEQRLTVNLIRGRDPIRTYDSNGRGTEK